MKFRVVDGSLQRNLISPTSVTEAHEHISTAPSTTEGPVTEVPPIQVHDDQLIEEEQPVSHPDSEPQPIEIPSEQHTSTP